MPKFLCTSHGVMISEPEKQLIVNEFTSHWGLDTSGFVLVF